MSNYMPEPMRMRVVMTQLRTHIITSCERGRPWEAQSDYERMTTIIKDYPIDADLVAALGDGGARLMHGYTEQGMNAEAKDISADMQTPGERINKNPKLKEQVLQFLKMAYDQ
jgi:hypothetical protein